MTTNEIWVAAQEDGRRISGSEHTNQVTNKLRVSNLFTQHGTIRQRSARSSIGINAGSISLGAQASFYQDGMYDGPSVNDGRSNIASVKKAADYHDSPLWDIKDLDEVAQSYVEKTHPFNIRRLPAILRIRIMEMSE